MKCLTIDTTSSDLVVILNNEEKIDYIVKNIGKSGHSSEIMPTIDALLKRNGVDISSIDTFATVVGPGSFTGIRIGVAAVTAMSYANNAKRIAINAFELFKHNFLNDVISIDAGHGNLYAAKIINGKIDNMFFIEANNNDGKTIPVSNPTIDSYNRVIKEKVEANDFVNVFEPYYMRKSQAEREKDEI